MGKQILGQNGLLRRFGGVSENEHLAWEDGKFKYNGEGCDGNKKNSEKAVQITLFSDGNLVQIPRLSSFTNLHRYCSKHPITNWTVYVILKMLVYPAIKVQARVRDWNNVAETISRDLNIRHNFSNFDPQLRQQNLFTTLLPFSL